MSQSKLNMSEFMENEYNRSLNFWNEWLGKEEEIPKDFNKDTTWKEIGCDALVDIAATMASQNHVLDYGCGSGWASVIMVKNGCQHVTAVDVSENGVKSSYKYAEMFDAQDKIQFESITPTWLEQQEPDTYDGFFCCNVLDVIPTPVSEAILKGAAKVCKKGAKVILIMNPFFEQEKIKKGKMDEKEDRYLFFDGILRVVNHTDSEWLDTIQKYFKVVECKHFRWDGEADTVNRRIFILEK